MSVCVCVRVLLHFCLCVCGVCVSVCLSACKAQGGADPSCNGCTIALFPPQRLEYTKELSKSPAFHKLTNELETESSLFALSPPGLHGLCFHEPTATPRLSLSGARGLAFLLYQASGSGPTWQGPGAFGANVAMGKSGGSKFPKIG